MAIGRSSYVRTAHIDMAGSNMSGISYAVSLKTTPRGDFVIVDAIGSVEGEEEPVSVGTTRIFSISGDVTAIIDATSSDSYCITRGSDISGTFIIVMQEINAGEE